MVSKRDETFTNIKTPKRWAEWTRTISNQKRLKAERGEHVARAGTGEAEWVGKPHRVDGNEEKQSVKPPRLRGLILNFFKKSKKIS